MRQREKQAREVGEQGMMGRKKERRRLENPVFKMVDGLMADDYAISNLEIKPFHRAYLDKKLPCPHVSCAAQLGGSLFYEETGLAQHYRTKHAADRIGRLRDENIERQAWRLLRLKHGEETMKHVEWLSTFRRGEDITVTPLQEYTVPEIVEGEHIEVMHQSK
ncbi:hypothetical protein ACROYT_G015175 [Oculina patagonica]